MKSAAGQTEGNASVALVALVGVRIRAARVGISFHRLRLLGRAGESALLHRSAGIAATGG